MLFKPVSLAVAALAGGSTFLLTPFMVLSAAVEQESGEVGDDAQRMPFFKRLFRGVETPLHDMLRRKLDDMGNADVLTGHVCMEDAAGFGLQCTANDVVVADALNIDILDDGCAYQGDMVTFTADFKVQLNAQARHDIGIWFATDGDPNGDGAYTGTCTAATPAYEPEPDFLDLDGTNDPFPGENKASGIPDTCGDIDADHNPLLPMITLTVTCIDVDGNGSLDIPYCTSWRQPGANELCTSPLDAFPGSPSKCRCEALAVDEIPVPACDFVECANQYANDPCSFGECVIDPNVGSVCRQQFEPVSTPCQDGLYCTSFGGVPGDDDHCDGGGNCVGDPVDCGPGDQCNDKECDEGADACVDVPKALSTPCDDGLYCTSFGGVPGDDDHCDGGGNCVGDPVDCGPGDQCNDKECNEGADACVDVPKALSTPCDDGLYCTSFGGVPGDDDHCDGGGNCVGDPVDCGPGDQCNDKECNEGADACVDVPKALSTPCDDGLYCTSFGGVPGDDDHCDGGGNCVGDPVDCGPGDQCNDKECNEGADACVDVPKALSTPCDDGLYCTSFGGVPGDDDHCDGGGNCVGDPVDCGPGDQCNDKECNEGADACVDVPKALSTPCDDGLYCTSFGGVPGDDDHCDGGGNCVGDPVDCGPGDQCNDKECNEGADACVDVPKALSTPCDDGLYCTSFGGVPGDDDHCDGGGNCVGDPVDCGPGDQCNDKECNEGADACVDVPKALSTPCDDGLYCTSFGGVPGDDDHCDGGGNCVGDPVDCGPGDQCNDKECNEGADACVDVPKALSTPCDDGLYCTSFGGVPGDDDHCDGAGNCVGDPVDCDDGSMCTDPDTCDEGADTCVYTFICKEPCQLNGKKPTPPKELEFKYTNNSGDPAFDSVCITVDHPRESLLTDEMVDDGGFFTVSRQRKLNPELTVFICAKIGGTCTDNCEAPFTVHTSCSLPLFIGQVFGDGAQIELVGQLS